MGSEVPSESDTLNVVDALAQLLVADAVIRRAAVGADNDIVL